MMMIMKNKETNMTKIKRRRKREITKTRRRS